LVVTPRTDKPLRGLQLHFTELTHTAEATAQIPADHLHFNPVGYVNNQHPDVLLEGDRPCAGPAQAFTHLPLWVTVHVPPQTPPGDYRGRVELRCENAPGAAFPLTLHVWNFSLPRETHAETNYFSVWEWNYYGLPEGSPEWRTFWRKVCENYIQHRVSPSYVAAANWLLEEPLKKPETAEEALARFDRLAQYWLDQGLRINWIPTFQEDNPISPDHDTYYRTWQAHLAERGWLDKCCVYLGDEPHPHSEEGDRIIRAAQALHRAAPDLKVMCAFQEMEPDCMNQEEGGLRLFADDVDLLAIREDMYGPEMRAFVRERTAQGNEFWWYVHLFLYLHHSRLNPRLFFWLMVQESVPGCVLYSITDWSGEGVERFGDSVLMASPMGSAGVLLWPGRETLLSSVRWEILREGIEDYEYWRLLWERERERSPTLTREAFLAKHTDLLAGTLQIRSKAVVDHTRDLFSHEWSPDPETLYAARAQLAAAIEDTWLSE
jgi:hypothetical protein